MRWAVKASAAALAAVAITAGYRYVAGWDSPESWIGAGVVVGSWAVLLRFSPALISMYRELLEPLAVEVRRFAKKNGGG